MWFGEKRIPRHFKFIIPSDKKLDNEMQIEAKEIERSYFSIRERQWQATYYNINEETTHITTIREKATQYLINEKEWIITEVIEK